jgi:hypothetical protein
VANLTGIPSTITAGDSYTLTLTYSDYPATAGWGVSLAVAGVSVDSWTSVADGDAHVLTLPATETEALGAGTYQWRLRATNAGRVETIQTGTLTVAADLGAAAPGDLASYWEQLKTAAETALTTLMSGGAVQMATIMGRQTMFRSPKDCLQVIAHCEARIAAAQTRTFGTPVRFDVVGMR